MCSKIQIHDLYFCLKHTVDGTFLISGSRLCYYNIPVGLCVTYGRSTAMTSNHARPRKYMF